MGWIFGAVHSYHGNEWGPALELVSEFQDCAGGRTTKPVSRMGFAGNLYQISIAELKLEIGIED